LPLGRFLQQGGVDAAVIGLRGFLQEVADALVRGGERRGLRQCEEGFDRRETQREIARTARAHREHRIDDVGAGAALGEVATRALEHEAEHGVRGAGGDLLAVRTGRFGEGSPEVERGIAFDADA